MREPKTDAERRALELLDAGAKMLEIRATLEAESDLEAWELLQSMVPDTGERAANLYELFVQMPEGLRIQG